MKHKYFIIIFAVIICISTLLTATAFRKKNAETAEIYVKGELIETIDLSAVIDSYTFPIENNGHKNIILIENGSVSMQDADCPDKLCIKQGAIKNSSFPIVCLPNEVVIKIKGNTHTNSPDAVSR